MHCLRQRIGGFVVLSMLVLFMTACVSEEENAASESDNNDNTDDEIRVVTTIAQIGEPLSVIGDEMVDVESLMGPSVDPHLYNPTQSDISTVEEADMIFYNGLDLEANMVEVFEQIGKSKPVLAIGETLPEDALLTDEEGAVDPHIWFDLNLWQQALDAAVEELKAYAPDYADQLEENKQNYFEDMKEMKTESEKLADIPDDQRVLVTAHDAFGYFGEMHDMEVVGLQGLSTEDEIGVSDVNETIEVIKAYEVPAIFVESSVNQDSIQAVIEGASNEGVEVELGGELFSDAMGESGTEKGTYIGMYRHNVNTIYEALSEGGA
ncbi:metal ABC transporter solute-binding protein, Zn/Mn family [Lentibacillus sp. CBA3610]|uniref:metal ABC transporter solute-binding protein, Zn/Mn family n=1 Tax=Lentibacillus sp. CBA3610 TaxID=2518176 RepID=UPI001595652B|nr:zinc ABC transporter substrate-binding protein [Lentibacillus sp. CBA3610]QKY71742.1 manganese transporter [Lentibacillus sp. CBA3610]